jgi:hypothetical protein
LRRVGTALERVPDKTRERILRGMSDRSFYEMAAYAYTALLRTGISAHVAWKLVYEPLVRDVKNLRNAIARYDEVLRSLQLPKPFRVYGVGVSKFGYLTDSGLIGRSYGSNRACTRTVRTWALVRQKPLHSVVPSKFFRQYYGLNARLSTAWELTPLSFIVDWFLDVGGWLRQFDGSVYQIPFELLQSGYSVKDEYTIACIGRPTKQWDAFTGSANLPLVRGKVSRSVYTRTTGGISFSPSAVMQPIQLRLPNFGQLGTLSELIYLTLSGK